MEVTSENDDVKATVIKGGVGKDKVKIDITGKDTEFLEYHIRIFGKPWMTWNPSKAQATQVWRPDPIILTFLVVILVILTVFVNKVDSIFI